jgi:hypothetical protein
VSWLAAILVGVICGIAGAVLTMMAGDSITASFGFRTSRSGRLSRRLPARTAGFLVGLITGIVIMRVNAPHGAGAILLYQGLGILVTAGLLHGGIRRGVPVSRSTASHRR